MGARALYYTDFILFRLFWQVGGAPNMCSKKFPVVKSRPAAGEITNLFWSCGAERWGLPGVLPSDPFLFVCAVNNFTLYFFTQTSPPSSA